MFPLHKFARLPPHQQLRKALKTFTQAERDIAAGMSLNGDMLSYLNDIASLLPCAAGPMQERPAPGETLRWINAVRHELLAKTGRLPADWDFIDHEGKLDPAKRRPFPGMAVYLEDIRSPFNVGAMFRTAEYFGAEKVWLSPACADPLHPRALRASMGCVEALPWERTADITDRTTDGIFTLETGGTPLAEFTFPKRGVLAAGSEELGVSPALLARADSSLGRVSIPGYGAKASLNVSAAFAIAMCAWAGALGE